MEYLASIKSVLESLLFVSGEPLSASKLCKIIGADEAAVGKALEELAAEYEGGDRGIQIRKVAGGYGFYTRPENGVYIDQLVKATNPKRLTQAALEVLATVAYKQPATRAEINSIRGVNSEAVISTLMEKGLIKEDGRAEGGGMPILYVTTKSFLEALGMNDLKELPLLEQFVPDGESAGKIREQLKPSASDAL